MTDIENGADCDGGQNQMVRRCSDCGYEEELGTTLAITRELQARLAELEAENETLHDAMSGKISAAVALKRLHFDDGFFEASVQSPMFQLIIEFLVQLFIAQGGANCVEMRCDGMPGTEFEHIGPLALLLQRINGKTPMELRGEVLAENAALKARIAELEALAGEAVAILVAE